MPVAYPYVVECKVTNENTREERLEQRQTYAYNVTDAAMQVVIEIAGTGSARVEVLRIGPPVECYARDIVTQMSEALSHALAPLSDAARARALAQPRKAK